MAGIDKAAEAFDTEISAENGAPSSSDNGGDDTPSTLGMEDMFPHLQNHETDVEAGGDNLGADGKPEKRRRKAEVDADDPDADDADDPDADDADDPDADDPDADDPGADDADDPDADDPDADDSPVYKVMVDGEEAEVSLNEALSGYIRQETFHRRLNKLNETEQEIAGFGNKLLQERVQVVEMIDQLKSNIEALIPAEPDWDKVYAENPTKARQLQKDYEAARAKLGELDAARAKAVKDAQEQNNLQLQRWRQGEAEKLGKLFPTWSDPVKGTENMKRDVNAMANTARAAGFSDAEIQSTYDSRMIVILNKAAAYDRIMSKRQPVPVKKGKTPVTHGAGRVSRTAPKGVARNMKQLQRTGKPADAAAVFDAIIKGR